MANLLVEIGNTALKAAWAEGHTLGKIFRYQGERKTEYITSLTEREKPVVLVVASVYDISASEERRLSRCCSRLVILDGAHKTIAEQYGLPAYLTYDRVASLIAVRSLFSGKDCTKVDRSAAYAARWVAKNVVAAGLAKRCQVQLAYAIGVAKPVSVRVDTFGTSKVSDSAIADYLAANVDLRPAAIIERFGLRRPIYRYLAAYGHMGRTPKTVTKTFTSLTGEKIQKEVELFTWEKLNKVEQIKRAFNL